MMGAHDYILKKFDPIQLKEMNDVKLMNRTDTKFTFNLNRFEAVMEDVQKNYRILDIDGSRLCRYETLYYDTPAFHLYTQHHNAKLNRYKIRHRTYVESGLGFLEVKFKNNKGRTIKDRIKKPDVPYLWEKGDEEFLRTLLPFEPAILVPALWVNYSRLTLVSNTNAERVTIDLNLEFVRKDQSKNLNQIVIAEVKQEKKKPSEFMKVMKKYHIAEGSISKYCLGVVYTCDQVKKNNFKSKLLSLKHKIHDDHFANS
ncbi:MAG: polyphosphate polymerase domain-containing protein [Bacteroidia bacterium]